MSDLLNLQKQFQSYLLHDDVDMQNHIVNTQQVSADTRLMIYADAYRSRLLEALEASYPALKEYLGDEAFYHLGHEYLDCYPSTFRSIRWFGDKLPDYLQVHAEYHEYPYLAELARVEWIMSLVFDAEDCEILTADDLLQLPAEAWENLQIAFTPSVHVLSLSSNVVQIWRALTDDEEVPEPEYYEQPLHWVFWRNELINQYLSVIADEASVMNNKNMTFTFLCENFCQEMEEEQAVMRAASLLRKWIDNGMIRNIK